jgi:hypothetical protein
MEASLMKKNLILIVMFVLVTFFLIGAASASTNVSKISVQKTVKTTAPQDILINSGANKFYWGERGGIFAYTWKTYRKSTGSVYIKVNYKTPTNSWVGTYTITKASNNKLKIVYTSPEIKLYSGHSSEISYAVTSLTPVNYYFNVVKSQIQSDGYFFV